MRIGELLVKNGLISDDQLAEALEEQRLRPGKLGEILIAKGFINESQLVEALEFQLGVPVVKLTEIAFDPSRCEWIPESVARKHRIFPVGRDGGKLRLAMVDPLNQEAVRDVQKATGLRVQPMIAATSDMQEALVRYYGADDPSRELEAILLESMRLQASSIRLEARPQGLFVRYFKDESRVQGEEKVIAKSGHLALADRIKQIAGLKTGSVALPQFGRFRTDVDHKPIDVRVSTLPSRDGECFYLLLSDPYTPLLTLSEMDFSENHRQKVEQAIRQTSGSIVISGPPGSGRTSLAYALLQQIAKDGRNIITLENLIKRPMPDMTQVEVAGQEGMTMARALQAALRHRPDVVMMDEIGDADTAETAMLASRFGTFVLGTMTSNGIYDTLGRLTAWVRDRELLAASLSCIVFQRLVRKVCQQCQQSVSASEEEQRLFESNGIPLAEETVPASKGVIGNFRSYLTAQVSGKPSVTRGEGCRLCGNSGYRGFVAVHEVLSIDDTLRERIAAGESARDIRQSLHNGGRNLLFDGLQKARKGLTTADELIKSVT
ncbi:AAA family ATPase [Cohnella sp. CFH 77786]|uniref:GspE/PulE family protein n=1 Tax=Cohnella sp. CFH 77786 TaxID=2662265 RepID=UPI001C60894F|nr:ATPase, T2SS/T4P/T4SS family [Cohnella sp. CFH 77786]MBW5445815.1 AAA family ATPase [Cohnella sp. CFH 77786]